MERPQGTRYNCLHTGNQLASSPPLYVLALNPCNVNQIHANNNLQLSFKNKGIKPKAAYETGAINDCDKYTLYTIPTLSREISIYMCKNFEIESMCKTFFIQMTLKAQESYKVDITLTVYGNLLYILKVKVNLFLCKPICLIHETETYAVNTPPASPNSVLLALSMTSSSQSNSNTDNTDPNISSFTTVMLSWQPESIQGEINTPPEKLGSGVISSPPHSTFAP